ncbi:hypothetical protein A5724_11870 [Mycobacterium sp. ACS1612]|nr:hypothetical protein A5724_11870 [Mycobacterium sp. ACS1612]
MVAILTAVASVLSYFNYKSKRDRIASVGNSFASTVDALSTDNEVKRMAAAVLLRRFFDRTSEQGVRGAAPYRKEAVEVIAGMLREPQPQRLQKVLADGLRYAVNLRNSDLQNCDLSNAYLGQKAGDDSSLDMSHADLFKAICVRTSFKKVKAVETVFYGANLERAVFTDADCQKADFREAELSRAVFTGAQIGGAKFKGALNIPAAVSRLLDDDGVAAPQSVVTEPSAAR